MATSPEERLGEQITTVLSELSDEEQVLFSAVFKLEMQNLYLIKPRIKDDLLKLVRQSIA